MNKINKELKNKSLKNDGCYHDNIMIGYIFITFTDIFSFCLIFALKYYVNNYL